MASEHPFQTIRKVMESAKSSGTYPRLMLLCGREEYLIRWAVSYVKDCVISPASESLDFVRFDCADADYPTFLSACESYPLMSAKKLTVLDANELFSSTKTDPAGVFAASLVEYLPDIPETSMLVLVCPKPNKTRSLYKSCQKYGLIFDFTPLDDATLVAWMQKRLKSAGKSANPNRLLSFALKNGYNDKDSSYTLYDLENDLKKVIAYSEEDILSDKDFEVAQVQSADTDAFRLLDSAFSDNKENAYRILYNSLDLSQPSKAVGVILSFTGLLISQLELMLESMERKAEGQSFERIQKEMGTNPYRLRKAMEAASSRSIGELKDCLDRAYSIEVNTKNGMMDPVLAMEVFIAEL